MAKTIKTAVSVIDLTANPLFAEALALQSRLAGMTADISALRGERNDAEFRQYIATALAAVKMGIAPRSKGATAMREAFIGAGRTKRNSQTIVEATLNKRVSAMARIALTDPDPVANMVTALADVEVTSVSSWKRWLAPATDRVEKLMEAVARLEGDDAESFATQVLAWIESRDTGAYAEADADAA